MNKNKLLSVVITVLVVLFTCLPVSAACSSRQQNRICTDCKQQGLNSCPQCTTTSCPTTTCPAADTTSSTVNKIKSSYTAFFDLKGDRIHNYSLNFFKSNNLSLDYTVNYIQGGIQFTSKALVAGPTINIILPVASLNGTFYTCACSIVVQDNGNLFGACSTLQYLGPNSVNLIGGALNAS